MSTTRATSHRSTRPEDSNTNPIVSYDPATPIEPNLLIEDILRTRYCIPGSVFLVEAIEPCIAVNNRYRTIQVILGDGKLCIQALLRSEIHCFVDNGHIFEGCYVRVDKVELRSVDIKGETRKMAYLLVSDMITVGWSRTYLDILGVQHPPSRQPTWSPAGGGGFTKSGKLTIAQLAAMDPETALKAIRSRDTAPLPVEPTASIPTSPTPIKHDPRTKLPEPESDSDYISDSDESVDPPEVPAEPRAIERPADPPSPRPQPAIIRQQALQRANNTKPSITSAPVAPPARAPASSKAKPTRLHWKVTDLTQGPFMLRRLVEVNTVKMLQNFMMNVLAVVVSVDDPGLHHGSLRRTARLADPSTPKEVLLAVYLDPEAFTPRAGSIIMITGVKNHTEDGGSLRKWPSDRLSGGRPWWTDDPGALGWCRAEVELIARWWEENRGEVSGLERLRLQ
ncbi:hypothetical protein QBC39DRAFT_252306 [Podospora conica]|nr:hypothetical protein QBC39DRAFT_252306 [Schizothecium conicum]